MKISFPPPTPKFPCIPTTYPLLTSYVLLLLLLPLLLPSFPPLPPPPYKWLSQTMLYWMCMGVGHPWEPENPRSQNLLEKECVSFLPKLSVATNSSVTGGRARRVLHASVPRSLHLCQRVCLTWFCACLFCDVTHTSIHPLKWTQDGPKKGLRQCDVAQTSIHPPKWIQDGPKQRLHQCPNGWTRSFYWRYLWKQKWRPKAAASAKSPPQQRWELTKAAALPEALCMASR